MRATEAIPRKLFYKIGEVCEITDTQPYVLRFWESEFPQLAPRKNRSGQRVYQRRDIDTVIRIKKLLYEEEYTIAGARRKLEEEPGAGRQDAGDLVETNDLPDDTPHAGTGPLAAGHGRATMQESEHPVDVLADRMASMAARRSAGAKPDAEREARLEKALRELKKSLKEILPRLRKDS